MSAKAVAHTVPIAAPIFLGGCRFWKRCNESVRSLFTPEFREAVCAVQRSHLVLRPQTFCQLGHALSCSRRQKGRWVSCVPKMPVPHRLVDKPLRMPRVWPGIACRTETGVMIPRWSAKCRLRHPGETQQHTIVNARAHTHSKLLSQCPNKPPRLKHRPKLGLPELVEAH